MKKKNLDPFWFFWTPFLLLGSARLLYLAIKHSDDFSVYWKAATVWTQEGKSPYLSYLPIPGFIFKYPPWVLPFFLPFGFLNFELSKFIWTIIEFICLGYSVRWVLLRDVPRAATFFVLISFTYIWISHFAFGQFSLVMMALALYWESNPTSRLRSILMVLILSAKIFSLNTLLGAWKFLFRKSLIIDTLSSAVFLTGIVYTVLYYHGNSMSLADLCHSWLKAANSGGNDLPVEVIRGSNNQGLTAGLLRALKVNPQFTQADIVVFLSLTAFLAPIWAFASRRLNFSEQWAGWLGLGLIAHPLAWEHSFVLAFPICTLALGASLKSRNRLWIATAVLGILSIGMITHNILLDAWVRSLELVCMRSWGVCLSAIALVGSKQNLNHRKHPT